AGICTAEELDAIDAAAAAEVDAAIEAALQSPVTPASETLTDVFADTDSVPRRGHHPVREAEAETTGETKPMTMVEAILARRAAAWAASARSTRSRPRRGCSTPRGSRWSIRRTRRTPRACSPRASTIPIRPSRSRR